ncbi:MAG: Chromate transporter [Hyphomicrobiales bacterium]|nr:Chromate transporter [Hyphomicrobiales bacterium]
MQNPTNPDPPAPDRSAPAAVGLGEIFVAFLLIGLMGFGGIAASAHYVIVERNRWLDQREFVELFGVCSILPGGNFLNATVMLGDRYQGPLGSVTGLCALLLAPLLILLALVYTYETFSYLPDVQGAIAGAAAAAAGLIVGTSAKLVGGLKKGVATLVFGAATFLAVGVLRAPLAAVVLVIVPLSVAVSLISLRKGARAP